METFSVRVDTFMANILFLLFIWPFSAFLCEFISRFFMFPCCHFPFHFVLFFNNPQFTYFLLLILTITPPVLKPQSTLHFGDPNKMDKIQFSRGRGITEKLHKMRELWRVDFFIFSWMS